MRRLTPLLLLSSIACAPQNAEITSGQFTAFLPIGSSRTLFEDSIDLEKADDWYQIDCRRGDDVVPLPNAEPVCDGFNPRHEQWLIRDGFQVVNEDLNPWRGEGIITSEGDFQLGFHHRLPGGADFRFALVVDPDFQPQRCVSDEDGEGVHLEDIDGADWLTQWSNDVESGTLYYLNSGAFQFDPSNTDRVWSLPQEWRAGYASGRFGGDDLAVRRVRYGLPSAYSSYETEDTALDPADLFYTPMDAGDDPTTNSGFQQQITRVNNVATVTTTELETVLVDHFAPVVHTNEWRPPDGLPAGLDSWVELHYAWVHFDDGSDLAVGGAASGEFAMVFDAFDSQTRVFVTGEFDVPRIKRDRWVTRDVMEAKLEESGTTLCGLGPEDI